MLPNRIFFWQRQTLLFTHRTANKLLSFEGLVLYMCVPGLSYHDEYAISMPRGDVV